jgi:indole-3-glycerol phosphate synthase
MSHKLNRKEENMTDLLKKILENRKNSLEYDVMVFQKLKSSPNLKVRKTISENIDQNGEISIISEIKLASPSLGTIKTNINIPKIAKEMEQAGVIGLSILTEPNYFNGSFEYLKIAVESTNLPCLMKDFVFDERQFQIAKQLGATNILLINALGNMEKMCEFAAKYNLEPLIEIHESKEIQDYERLIECGFVLKLIGVNNRNLKTLNIDLNISKTLIPKIKDRFGKSIKIISESGINNREDVNYLLPFNPDAFLIGSSIMKSHKIKEKIFELRGIN